MIITCPCKNCTKDTGRYPGCHDHCTKPEYKAWRDQENKRKKFQDQERAMYVKYRGMTLNDKNQD